MEDKKNAMRLDDEKLEQVAGGWGNRPYTDCRVYQDLLRIKNEGDVDEFKHKLEFFDREVCPNNEDAFYCYDCPVRSEWRF